MSCPLGGIIFWIDRLAKEKAGNPKKELLVMRNAKLFGIIALVAIIGFSITGCSTDTPEPTVTGVTVSPASVTLASGESQDFSATVEGTNSPPTTVTWTVEGGASGTSISTTGRLSVAANETAASLTVRATSTFDTTMSGTATVTVAAPPAATVTGVTISPASVTLASGESQDFSATVEGTNSPTTTVTWTGGH